MADELLPHPVTGQLFPSPVPPGTGWPGDPADAADAGGADRRRGTPARRALRDGRGARRPGVGLPGLPAAGRAGARRSPGGKRASFADQPYWGRPGPGFGDPEPRCSSSGWRRRPTAATAPAGCSPATAPATGCSPRCTGPASRASRPACPAGDGLALTGAADGRGRALRAAGQQADAGGARHLRAVARPRARAAAPTLRVVLALGGIGWDAALALRPPARLGGAAAASRGSATAPRRSLVDRRPARAVRLLG